MRVKVNFSELAKALSYANTVLSDKSVEEKSKNFIFTIDKDSFKVIGFSAFIFSRTEIEDWSIEEDIPEEGWSFQVKATELNKIVSSFSSLYRTKVSDLYLYDEGVRIGVDVVEEAISDEYSKLAQTSQFYLENAPITGKVMTEIKTEFPENGEMLPGGDLSLYIETLFPIMANDSSSSMASKINFADDYVFVITSYMSAFMPNKLPDAMKGLALTYSSTSFLKKLSEASMEGVCVAKLEDKYLCVQVGTTEAFMKFQRIKVNYKMYVEKKSKELGVVVDRLYLKDVLKRMGNLSTDGKVLILEDGSIQVENTNFHQIIPVNNAKDGVSGISFNISIPILEKVILGRDDIFSGDVFLYFVPTTRGYLMYASDSTGAWFSNMQVSK